MPLCRSYAVLSRCKPVATVLHDFPTSDNEDFLFFGGAASLTIASHTDLQTSTIVGNNISMLFFPVREWKLQRLSPSDGPDLETAGVFPQVTLSVSASIDGPFSETSLAWKACTSEGYPIITFAATTTPSTGLKGLLYTSVDDFETPPSMRVVPLLPRYLQMVSSERK